jgi:tRNA (guanine37-N1)-methyltransferase
MAFHATVLTLYPDMFPGPLGQALAGRALGEGRWRLDVRDIRQAAGDRHRTVDGPPAGGGPGMVLRADVAARAIDAARPAGDPRPLLALSARGEVFGQAMAHELAGGPGAILLCGRFEGIDQRVLEARAAREVSVGDYVLAGGEIAAMAVLDACVRLLPGVMGAADSRLQESHEDGLLEYPQYTLPREWEGRPIPPVLLSGDHGKVAAWRRAEAMRITAERRPDLLEARPPRAT